MKQEKSAGGVIIRKEDNIIIVLLIRDMNGNWTFPKGLIEPNETAEQAALREIAEETGLRKLKLLTALKEIHYQFQRQNESVSKTVTYYLYEELEDETVICQKEEGISAYNWLPLEKALDFVSYPKSNRQLINEVIEYLKIVKL
jgi:mutator protein MutT